MTFSSPIPVPESEHYWQAANDGVLLLKQCASCTRTFHYPRAICPHCMSRETHWVEASGLGTVYSFTVIRRGPGTGTAPAFITLDEGPTLMAGLIDCDPEDVKIGDRVRVQFAPSQNGQMIPLFTTLNESGNA